MIDYFIALLPALFLGFMSIVLVAQGGDDRQKTLGTLGGAFLFSALATPFIDVHWTTKTLLISFLSGLILGFGQYLQILCLKILGVSRTMPLTTAGQIIFMCLGGIILFGEMNHGLALVFALSSIALLTLGVVFISKTEKTEKAAEENVDWKRGTILLVVSTTCLVAYLLIVQGFGLDGRSVILPQSVGYFLVALIATIPALSPQLGKEDNRWSLLTLRQLIPGMMWGAAILLTQISSARLGVAVAFPLSQMGVIIQTFGGILILHETRTRREMRWTIIGVVIMVIGVIMVGVACSFS